jgi:hypothetical protein
MPFVEPIDPVADEATKVSWAESVDAAVIDHETRIQVIEGSALLNGSFEVSDSGDANGITPTIDGNASRALTTTEADVGHGQQAEAATMTATSGDTVTENWDDNIPVAPGQRVHFAGVVKNASGIKVTVNILWFYWTGAAYSAATDSDTEIYSASETFADYTRIHGSAVSPRGDAHDGLFWRLQIIVGGVGETTPGTVFLDGMECGTTTRTAPIARTSVWQQSDGTGTVDCSTALGDEFPNTATVQVAIATSSGGNQSVTIQGWSGTAWVTVAVESITAGHGVTDSLQVTLNPAREFNISATNVDNGNIYLVGTT